MRSLYYIAQHYAATCSLIQVYHKYQSQPAKWKPISFRVMKKPHKDSSSLQCFKSGGSRQVIHDNEMRERNNMWFNLRPYGLSSAGWVMDALHTLKGMLGNEKSESYLPSKEDLMSHWGVWIEIHGTPPSDQPIHVASAWFYIEQCFPWLTLTPTFCSPLREQLASAGKSILCQGKQIIFNTCFSLSLFCNPLARPMWESLCSGRFVSLLITLHYAANLNRQTGQPCVHLY